MSERGAGRGGETVLSVTTSPVTTGHSGREPPTQKDPSGPQTETRKDVSIFSCLKKTSVLDVLADLQAAFPPKNAWPVEPFSGKFILKANRNW